MTKERGILFSAPMVRAILDGRKTVTRRIVKPGRVVGKGWAGGVGVEFSRGGAGCAEAELLKRPDLFNHHCPYGTKGDRLWVRETWFSDALDSPDDRADELDEFRESHVYYRADADHATAEDLAGSWRPSIFMPRWASRITLEVTDVRVERLHEITEDDAKAEGVEPGRFPLETSRLQFQALWQEINGTRSPWSENCWVWRVAFKRLP